MTDYIIPLTSIALLTWLGTALWRRIADSPQGRSRAAGRVAIVGVLALATVFMGVYKLSSSRTFQVAGTLVPRVATQERVVALTFDDGPTPQHTARVLALLAEKDVSATFYLTGRESEENPSELRAIIDAGHELGNHAYSHDRMVLKPGRTIAEEITRTDAIFREAGYTAPTTFRPPGCKRLFATPLWLSANDRTTVTWDLEPDSLSSGLDAQALADQVASGVRPGSIVLMHVMYDSREPSREALPEIIDRLRDRGYRFVTVSQMLELAE